MNSRGEAACGNITQVTIKQAGDPPLSGIPATLSLQALGPTYPVSLGGRDQWMEPVSSEQAWYSYGASASRATL